MDFEGDNELWPIPERKCLVLQSQWFIGSSHIQELHWVIPVDGGIFAPKSDTLIGWGIIDMMCEFFTALSQVIFRCFSLCKMHECHWTYVTSRRRYCKISKEYGAYVSLNFSHTQSITELGDISLNNFIDEIETRNNNTTF